MRHEKRLGLLDHALNPRFLQRRWQCEWCDCPLAAGDVLCENCTRDMLDTEMEEDT
jgi:hypothetical protein